MQIDRRFADYGLTGGFFLICQLGLFWPLGYWPRILDQFQAVRLPPDTSLLVPIITGFAGALAVIAVFVTGLLLDLIASLFRAIEMRVFSRHLDRNSVWIIGLIEAHKAYCGTDYESFQRTVQQVNSLTFGKRLTYACTFWRRESGHFWAFSWWLGDTVRRYERLSSFFRSYITVQSGSAQLTLMADQYSLWRTARAIATALYLLSTEGFILFFLDCDTQSEHFFLHGRDELAMPPRVPPRTDDLFAIVFHVILAGVCGIRQRKEVT
jgi:hypothetical protein